MEVYVYGGEAKTHFGFFERCKFLLKIQIIPGFMSEKLRLKIAALETFRDRLSLGFF